MHLALLLFLIFGLPWWACALLLLRKRRERRWIALMHGIGLQTLAVLPVALVQPWINSSTTFDLAEKLWMPFASTGVHIGGWTVRSLFEPLADAGLIGQRQTTMISQWPIWIGLALVQSLLLGAIIAWRLRSLDQVDSKTRFDPVIALVLCLVVINAAANIQWPWWGS